ncbi:MAG: hypothetical protein AB1420_18210 [Bacillota bacterium]
MNIKGYSIPVIIFSFALTIGILISANWGYKELAINKPLSQQLSEIEGVKGYSINKNTNTVQLEVTLASVDNLQQTYLSIRGTAIPLFGKHNDLSVSLVDNPNRELLAIWDELQLAAYQALVQGDFLTLKETMNRLTRENKTVDYKITVDSEFLFIQLHLGDNYLYRVLTRN